MAYIYEERKQFVILGDPIGMDESTQEDCYEIEEDYETEGEVYMDF